MKTFVIGDIHGCYNELQDLLAMSGISGSDAVIALGDIVDRGPDTVKVLDFFRNQPNASSLMGNHERKHVRGARGEVKLALSQVISRMQLGENYAGALRLMETFPTWIELPEAILVHGYLEPGVPLENQVTTVLCGTMSGDRYLQKTYNRPWYELYQDSKPVITGHQDYQKNGQAFVYQERVFGLDTSCVHGKVLTGLILPDFTLVSVPSRGDHWKAARLQHRQQTVPGKLKGPQPAAIAWDSISERLLQEIIDHVRQENEGILARLRLAGFEDLPPRQQAKAYAVEVGEMPFAPLMHLARRGELDLERARKIIRDPIQASKIAKKISTRDPNNLGP